MCLIYGERLKDKQPCDAGDGEGRVLECVSNKDWDKVKLPVWKLGQGEDLLMQFYLYGK